MKTKNDQLILVIAANGKTGKRVTERLKKDSRNVRSVSRSTEIPFDWNDSSTWGKALSGVNSIYAVFTPDLAVPGAPKIIAEFTEACLENKIDHVVLLSGRGEHEAQECEQILIRSGFKWTIVRASWFNQNFSESFFLEDVIRGQAIVPLVKGKEPFVDADDIADVVVASLLDSKHQFKLYEVTGPELLSFEEAFTKISAQTKRKIDVRVVPLVEYVEYLKSSGVPTEYIELLNYLFTEVLDGRNESICNGIYEALERPPGSFDMYVAKTLKNTKIW